MAIPNIDTVGRFVLTNPFVAKPSVIYSVIALRELRDLSIKGVNVYKEFYVSAGLTNETNINGTTFDFTLEVAKNPVIVTLQGSDGNIIYVPSTFIESFPNMGDVTYSRLILSADLGALPDTITVDSILSDIEQIISARFGVNASVKINRAASEKQPTPAEHDILEASRLGSISQTTNNYVEHVRLQRQNVLLEAKIKALTRILVENNLI